MKLNIEKLKRLMTKLNLAVEKSKLNPKSSWIEINATDDSMLFKVSNYDYYLESKIILENKLAENEGFHATILADTFIPLVSKLDVSEVEISEKLNSLIIESNNSSYTFPIIKELGKTRCVDSIGFEATSNKIQIPSRNLISVATVNTKGLVDAMFSQEVQQFIYLDEIGALTFTENMYVNDFDTKASAPFKLLLNATQAKLLQVFEDEQEVSLELEQTPTFTTMPTTTNKACFSTPTIKLILICQDQNLTDKFPSIKLRALSANEESTHVIVDKKELDKALARLMVFDKKFDITVMDYSKLVFKEDCVELISIKNKNFEKIPYLKAQNAIEHESIIRFADLVLQLKAITSKEVDISYGSRPAIVLNGNIKQLIPEIRVRQG